MYDRTNGAADGTDEHDAYPTENDVASEASYPGENDVISVASTRRYENDGLDDGRKHQQRRK